MGYQNNSMIPTVGAYEYVVRRVQSRALISLRSVLCRQLRLLHTLVVRTLVTLTTRTSIHAAVSTIVHGYLSVNSPHVFGLRLTGQVLSAHVRSGQHRQQDVR